MSSEGNSWKVYGLTFRKGTVELPVIQVFVKEGWYSKSEVAKIYAKVESEEREHPF